MSNDNAYFARTLPINQWPSYLACPENNKFGIYGILQNNIIGRSNVIFHTDRSVPQRYVAMYQMMLYTAQESVKLDESRGNVVLAYF